MNGVVALPVVVWRERENTERPSRPVIRYPSRKKSTVSAIMLNHEKPNETSGRWYREQIRGPSTTFGWRLTSLRMTRLGNCGDRQIPPPPLARGVGMTRLQVRAHGIPNARGTTCLRVAYTFLTSER